MSLDPFCSLSFALVPFSVSKGTIIMEAKNIIAQAARDRVRRETLSANWKAVMGASR